MVKSELQSTVAVYASLADSNKIFTPKISMLGRRCQDSSPTSNLDPCQGQSCIVTENDFAESARAMLMLHKASLLIGFKSPSTVRVRFANQVLSPIPAYSIEYKRLKDIDFILPRESILLFFPSYLYFVL